MRRAVAASLLIPLFGTAVLGCSPTTNAPTPSAPTTPSATTPSPTTESPTTQSPTAQSPTSQGSATPTAGSTPTGPTRPTPTGNGLRQDWHFVTDDGARGTFTVPSKTNKLVQRIETERKGAKGSASTMC